MGECKWIGGCVVVVWVRRTLAPLQPAQMIDAVPALPPPPPGALPSTYVDNVGPAPVVLPDGAAPVNETQRETQLLSGRMQHPAISPGRAQPIEPAQLPALAPAIPSLPRNYHLPAYARPREGLPTQRNVTERTAVSYPTTPETAPAYQPPPTHSPAPGVTIGGAGLLASAEVRPFGGPLPPSPLDCPPPPQESSRNTALGAVPPVPPGLAPARQIEPQPRGVPQAANVAVAARGVTDRSGYTETPQTAPARLTTPPINVSVAPPDKSLQPPRPLPEPIAPHVEEPETVASAAP